MFFHAATSLFTFYQSVIYLTVTSLNNHHFGSPSSIDENVSVFIKEGRKPLVWLSQLEIRMVSQCPWATKKNSSFDTRGGELTKLIIWTSVSVKKFPFRVNSPCQLYQQEAMVCSVRGRAFTIVSPVFLLGSTAAYEAWSIEGIVASAKVVA